MNSTLTFLYSLHKLGMKFGLRNIRALLKSAGNPHKSFRTIHVAGTNGKGSTSSMIAAILTAAGYKVGLYTSPHLVTFNERIRINGKMIPTKEIARYTELLRQQIIKQKTTFFEATTTIAFKYFADQKVDIAVIETGLGGRLDSTNVLTPMVSIITSIGKDHTELLGNTILSIAKEKAGIIKRNVPVIIGNVNSSAKAVISKTAKQKGSVLFQSSKLKIPADIDLQLKGRHQHANAKAAIGAINIVSRHLLIGNKAIREGLERTTQLSGLRARFELRKGRPDVLFDVAHNPDGIKTLVSELKKLPYKRFVIVFGVMKDKDFRSILQQFKKINVTIIATEPNIERALPAEQLYSICKKMNLRCFHASNVHEAIELGERKTKKNRLLVFTGSHYLLGEVLQAFEKKS
ncbi:MAG: folylpolyglutamate synthase/dihydrofolate synthase family protein [Bacteroidota bacterium]